MLTFDKFSIHGFINDKFHLCKMSLNVDAVFFREPNGFYGFEEKL